MLILLLINLIVLCAQLCSLAVRVIKNIGINSSRLLVGETFLLSLPRLWYQAWLRDHQSLLCTCSQDVDEDLICTTNWLHGQYAHHCLFDYFVIGYSGCTSFGES